MKSIRTVVEDITASIFAIVVSISILACVSIPILLIVLLFKLLMS